MLSWETGDKQVEGQRTNNERRKALASTGHYGMVE